MSRQKKGSTREPCIDQAPKNLFLRAPEEAGRTFHLAEILLFAAGIFGDEFHSAGHTGYESFHLVHHRRNGYFLPRCHNEPIRLHLAGMLLLNVVAGGLHL